MIAPTQAQVAAIAEQICVYSRGGTECAGLSTYLVQKASRCNTYPEGSVEVSFTYVHVAPEGYHRMRVSFEALTGDELEAARQKHRDGP